MRCECQGIALSYNACSVLLVYNCHMLQNLVQKLKPGGRMVIPVGAQNSYQVQFCMATPFALWLSLIAELRCRFTVLCVLLSGFCNSMCFTCLEPYNRCSKAVGLSIDYLHASDFHAGITWYTDLAHLSLYLAAQLWPNMHAMQSVCLCSPQVPQALNLAMYCCFVFTGLEVGG